MKKESKKDEYTVVSLRPGEKWDDPREYHPQVFRLYVDSVEKAYEIASAYNEAEGREVAKVYLGHV